ncbi:MAG: hypothetical protein HY691_20215 [Chloroflexi bacterium]|nr:hypothetical protein [Chloroflexota bacterium]
MARIRRRVATSARRDKKKARPARPAPPAASAEPVAAAAPEQPAAARRPITIPAAAAAGAAAARRAVSRASQPALHTDYQAIGRDLRRVGGLGALMILTLAVLTFVLR